MASIIFYEKPGCANNTRQKKLLQSAGHELISRNLLSEAWTAESLRVFFGELPVSEWFNRAAPRIKSGDVVPERLDKAAALALMLADPILIRRPLMECAGRRIAGFDAMRVTEWLGSPLDNDVRDDLQTCHREPAAPPCPDKKPPSPGGRVYKDDRLNDRAENSDLIAPTMTQHNDQDIQTAAIVAAYHQRTKHRLERYAAGPETLDWTMQPDPFREFAGSPRIILPLGANELNTTYARVYDMQENMTPHPVSLATLAMLLELSLGISAWKEYGPDRWALRCNPSSGNLHPTEAYVLCRGVSGLEDGVYHYLSRDHVLEQRCRATPEQAPQTSGVWIALSSIHWREAWKYGERAFRYCQLDIGHALGALRYAAGVLGWNLKMLPAYGSDELATLLGLNRDADFLGAEKEDPDVLLAVLPQCNSVAQTPPPGTWSDWRGRANLLDPHPMYRWPVIAEIAVATVQHTSTTETSAVPHYPPLSHNYTQSAAQLIHTRRSAQSFDRNYVMPTDDFYRLVDCLLPRNCTPWDIWDYESRLHPVLFVHRVADLAPGLYALPRSPAAETALRASMQSEFQWQKVAGCPDHIPLYLLTAADCAKLARTVSCHQVIASHSCFSLGMLAEFADIVEQDPWRYRQLHWEAGLLGQVLYLEAEAAGVRGTGIGCFFDDAVHELLGLRGTDFQTLYHFTVGRALVDERITTLPPYAERATHSLYKEQPK